MHNLLFQLAENDIALGFVFVKAVSAHTGDEDVARCIQACQLAESSYGRARKHADPLPPALKEPIIEQLLKLRLAIDDLQLPFP